MKVIARTSVEQFRDTKLTTKEIGEKLGVTKVLEGGVQRAGDRVRVTVQLVDAMTDTHLWAESPKRRDSEPASVLLDGAARVFRTHSRLGASGYWVADVAIHALRAQKAQALAALRDAEKAGWRGPGWRYFRDLEPNLASIRNESEFITVFAEIERDMAAQRAQLAARPKDTPLDVAPAR